MIKHKEEKIIAVVLGHNYTSRLGMIRAAGEIGCIVDVIASHKKRIRSKRQIDYYSKYVNRYDTVLEQSDSIVKLLLERYKDEDNVILLPTDDFWASLIDNNYDLLKSSFQLPNIKHKQGEINLMMNKDVQKSIAVRAGFPVAKGWTIDIKNGIFTIPDDIIYPCFTKPKISLLGGKEKFMQKCDDENKLNEVLKLISNICDCPMLIEEYVPIDKEYATLGFRSDNDLLLPYMLYLKEQGQGGHKGVALCGSVIPMESFGDLTEKIKRFMDQIGFVGLFDIDMYEHDGIIYFNELNLRFGASGYAVTRTGINLPAAFINSVFPYVFPSNKIKVVKEEVTYLNEKVNFDSYINGFIPLTHYKKNLNSDIKFIQSREDPKPYRFFLIWSLYMRIKKSLKRELWLI